MNFVLSTICVLVLVSPWIPSIAGSRSSSLERVLEDNAGIQTVLVVSTDGRPDHFASVQAAVDAVPMWNYLRWVIYITPGVYVGPVIVPQGKV